MRRSSVLVTALFSLVLVGGAFAAEEETSYTWQKYFVGWESEPTMEYGGRNFVSLDAATCDLGSMLIKKPGMAPLYEMPAAIIWSTFHHEFNGHGARAREFNMKPGYGAGFDLSAYTYADRKPDTMLELSSFVAGGTEADGVLAHSMMLDALSEEKMDAYKIPLMFMAKIDLGLYVLMISKPERPKPNADTTFEDEYTSGYDPAFYLVTRQGRRRDLQNPANPDSMDRLWDQDYVVDYDDPLLKKNYDDMKAAAIWSILDPSVWASMYTYVMDHAIRGAKKVHPFVLKAGDKLAFSVGTRAYIDPDDVTRYLDLYMMTPFALVNVYARDLNSSVDKTHGFGGAIHHVEIGRNVAFSVQADFWDQPRAEEKFYKEGSAFNLAGELEVAFSRDFGVVAKVGHKSDGYLAGLPADSGAYMGLGATFQF